MASEYAPPTYDEVLRGEYPDVDTGADSGQHGDEHTAANGQKVPPSYTSLYGQNKGRQLRGLDAEALEPSAPEESTDASPDASSNTRPASRISVISGESVQDEQQTQSTAPTRRIRMPKLPKCPKLRLPRCRLPRCNLSSGRQCKERCKGLDVVFLAAAYVLALPVCIALIVISVREGPVIDLQYTSANLDATTMLASSTDYFHENTTEDYNSTTTVYYTASLCPAESSLTLMMQMSGIEGLITWVGVIIVFVKKQRSSQMMSARSGACPCMILLAVILISLCFGSTLIYKLWNHRPAECAPFSGSKCPASYCDNLLISFAVIFYPTSLILLVPVFGVIFALTKKCR